MTQWLLLSENKHNFDINIRQQVSCTAALLTSAHNSVLHCPESLSDIVSELDCRIMTE